MEVEKEINQIKRKLDNHEKRIRVLETGKYKVEDQKINGQTITHIDTQKQLTLAEIILGKRFKSGQEKIAIVVGYYEKIFKKSSIKEAEIKAGWIRGKFNGKYRSNLLERAVGDGLVRDLEDKTFDLSQTGEKFFDNFLKSNVRKNQKGT